MRLRTFFCTLLAAVLLCPAASPARAEHIPTEEEILTHLATSPTAVTINEYDLIQAQKTAAPQLDKLPTDEDKQRAMQLSRYSPNLHFWGLRLRGRDYLESHGYPPEQVEAILSFRGGEADIRAASASVTTDLVVSEYVLANGESVAAMSYLFSWSGVPVFQETDRLVLRAPPFYYVDLTGACVAYAVDANGNHTTVNLESAITESFSPSVCQASVPLNTESGRVTAGCLMARFSSLNSKQSAPDGAYLHPMGQDTPIGQSPDGWIYPMLPQGEGVLFEILLIPLAVLIVVAVIFLIRRRRRRKK